MLAAPISAKTAQVTLCAMRLPFPTKDIHPARNARTMRALFVGR